MTIENATIQLITHAENLYARQKKSQESQKTRLIKPGSGRPLN